MVRPVTLSFRETTKGHNSALTVSDFARTNGDLLNAGWSAMERSLAVTPPDRIENFRSPSFTSLPSPWLSLDSSIGRNWLALIRNGKLITATISSARAIPRIRAIRFIQGNSLSQYDSPASDVGPGSTLEAMNTTAHDIRYALRIFLKSPTTTVVAIVSLALGIGANTAIFSLMNALVLRSLPIRDPAQLVRLYTTTPQNPDRETENSLPPAMYQQRRKDQHVFSDLFAWSGGGIVNIEANGAKYAASLTTVTGEHFSTLGIQPHLGRLIAPPDLNQHAEAAAARACIS